ncbi:MAG: hypothetical protein ACLFTK_10365, partial [Anaerolineales bacterium]
MKTPVARFGRRQARLWIVALALLALLAACGEDDADSTDDQDDTDTAVTEAVPTTELTSAPARATLPPTWTPNAPADDAAPNDDADAEPASDTGAQPAS